jgi:hypothetical protein
MAARGATEQRGHGVDAVTAHAGFRLRGGPRRALAWPRTRSRDPCRRGGTARPTRGGTAWCFRTERHPRVARASAWKRKCASRSCSRPTPSPPKCHSHLDRGGRGRPHCVTMTTGLSSPKVPRRTGHPREIADPLAHDHDQPGRANDLAVRERAGNRPEGAFPVAAGARSLSTASTRATLVVGVIAMPRLRSPARCRPLSPLKERSSHDVEANAAVERCRSRTKPATRASPTTRARQHDGRSLDPRFSHSRHPRRVRKRFRICDCAPGRSDQRKLDVRTRGEASAAAMRLGLISPRWGPVAPSWGVLPMRASEREDRLLAMHKASGSGGLLAG